MGIALTLKNVRLSCFGNGIWVKKAFRDGKPAYSAHFILSADDPQVAAVDEAQLEAATEKWGAKAAAYLKAAEAKDKVALHDGDAKADTEGYAGNWYVAARTQQRFLIVDRDKTPLTQDDGKPYSGCYVDASIEFFGYDFEGVKGVSAGIRWIQFRRDGDAFAGGTPASLDEIEDISVADEDLI
jgi:hypothetical protein